MAKRICVVLLGMVFAVVVFVAFVRDPTLNMCAESIRGYERRTIAEIDTARSSLIQIEVELGDTNTYSQPLDELTPAHLGVLNAMDRQCKLLAKCMRLSPFGSAKTSCRAEYEDYQKQVDEGLGMLMTLSRTAGLSQDAAATQAASVRAKRQRLSDLSDNVTSGATGGRIRVLRASIEAEKRRLRETALLIQAQIGEFLDVYATEN